MPNEPATQSVYGQLGAASNVYVQGDAVKVIDAAGNIRVYLGNIPGGDYGLQVVSSDGATVIIDGTSDIFKIVATGTTSVTVTANNYGFVEVTLSGLGNVTATPAFQGYVTDANNDSSDKSGFYDVSNFVNALFAA